MMVVHVCVMMTDTYRCDGGRAKMSVVDSARKVHNRLYEVSVCWDVGGLEVLTQQKRSKELARQSDGGWASFWSSSVGGDREHA